MAAYSPPCRPALSAATAVLTPDRKASRTSPGNGLEDEASAPQGDVFQRKVVRSAQMRLGLGQPLGAGVYRIEDVSLP